MIGLRAYAKPASEIRINKTNKCISFFVDANSAFFINREVHAIYRQQRTTLNHHDFRNFAS